MALVKPIVRIFEGIDNSPSVGKKRLATSPVVVYGAKAEDVRKTSCPNTDDSITLERACTRENAVPVLFC